VGGAPRCGAEDGVRDGLAEAGSSAIAALRPRGLVALLLARLAGPVVVRPAGLPLAVAAITTGHVIPSENSNALT